MHFRVCAAAIDGISELAQLFERLQLTHALSGALRIGVETLADLRLLSEQELQSHLSLSLIKARKLALELAQPSASVE